MSRPPHPPPNVRYPDPSFMQRNGAAGPRHTAINGGGAINGDANGSGNGSNRPYSNGSSERSLSPPRKGKRSPQPPARNALNGGLNSNGDSSASSSSSSSHQHRRIALEEGLELTREPWRQQGKVSPGWESNEEEPGVVMGGGSSRSLGTGRGDAKGYAVLDREEPLLGDGNNPPAAEVKHPRDERWAWARLFFFRYSCCSSPRLRR